MEIGKSYLYLLINYYEKMARQNFIGWIWLIFCILLTQMILRIFFGPYERKTSARPCNQLSSIVLFNETKRSCSLYNHVSLASQSRSGHLHLKSHCLLIRTLCHVWFNNFLFFLSLNFTWFDTLNYIFVRQVESLYVLKFDILNFTIYKLQQFNT